MSTTILRRCLVVLVAAAAIGGLSACGGDDSGQPDDEATGQSTDAPSSDDTPPAQETETPAESGDDATAGGPILDGADPCGLLDQGAVEQATGTPVVTAEPTSDDSFAVCYYNSAEPGVSSGVSIFANSVAGRDDLLADADGRTQDTITIPGSDDAWVTRGDMGGQPDVQACAVVGEVTACGEATDSSGDNGVAELEPMATSLTELLVEAL